ncbi:hypothetical protein C8P68_10552 [Mucilaginibacter yixingensis]|uniref:Outer membrane protein with beta-barrel domain n=1 Tax=Mucilaginibacter yixingensis TaxID=1295612 RepID=A0A2T5J7V8_9SPHI|nr:hypothetical protein [Mucilaginibacter yixingensis]PTQ95547.1 hypothetical protein C8P68_10552 [Mucilaginibacter yixingensis]
MKLLPLTLIVCLFVSFQLSAQTNFKPGYIVTHGDTLRGEIDYRQWNNNPREVHFRKGSNIETYNLSNATAFGINNADYFERYVVSASQAGTRADQLTTVDTTTHIDTVFLKIVSRGPNVNLYTYTDPIKTRFYIKTNRQEVPQELLYRVYLNDDDASRMAIRNIYRQQLINLANVLHLDNERLVNNINRTNYFEDDLEKIILKLNGGDAIGGKKTGQSKFRFFAGAGVNVQSLTYTGSISLAYNNPQTKFSAYPMISAGLDFIDNRDAARSYIRMQIYYTGNNLKASNAIATEMLDQRTLGISPQFLYNFYNAQHVKLFLSTGIVLNFSTYPKNITVPNSDPDRIVYNNFPNMRKMWFGVPLHAGVALNKRVEINLSYIYTMPLTDNYVEITGKTINFQGGVNYFFN